MAFYLAKNNRTEMFANLQNDLETAVESLSELLERPIEASTVAELRALTTDKTVVSLPFFLVAFTTLTLRVSFSTSRSERIFS